MRGHTNSTQPTPRRFTTNSVLASRPPGEPGGDGDDAAATRTLSDGEIYGLLKSPRRRFVLWYLDQVDESVPLGELAERTAAWENDEPVADVSSAERKRAYVALYQCHLPKLDAVGVVEFDADRKRVGVGPNYGVLERVLSPTAESTDDTGFAPYYLALALVAVAVLAGSAAVASPLDGVPLGVALIAVGSFATLAALDYYRSIRGVAAASSDLWKQVL